MRRLLVSSVLLGLAIGLLPGPAMAQTYSAGASATWIPNAQVRAMAVTSTRIYLGGDFTSLKNPGTGATVAASHLVALDRATGNPIASWNPSVPDGGAGGDSPAVGALMVSGSTLYVGGDFHSIDGQPRNYAAALDTNGNVTTWNPNLNDRVWDFAMGPNGNVFMVGLFGRVNVNSFGQGTLGAQRRSAALVNATTGALVGGFDANVEAGKTVQTVLVDGNTTYLGGTFTTLGGNPREYLASVDSTSGADTGWHPGSQCPVTAIDCRVRDLATDGTRLFVALGGESPGGRGMAFPLGSTAVGAPPLWTDIADGDVQTVAYYDGTVYFGGHFDKKFGLLGNRQDRRQFAAVDPANGEVRAYKLPFASPSKPGIWAITASAAGIWVAGGTQLISPSYKNFLAFAAPGRPIPGPVVATKVSVKTKGCKTCKVRLTENRGSGGAWTSSWKKAKKGKVSFTVPTINTRGLTVQVDAPWEKKQKKTAEAVMRYKGQGIGAKVSTKEAEKGKKATSCYAGTGSSSIKFTLKVKKVKSGKKVGTRAWAKTTQKYGNPMRKSKKGVLSTKKPTKCS